MPAPAPKSNPAIAEKSLAGSPGVPSDLPNKGSAFDPSSGKFFEFSRDGFEGDSGRIVVTRYWPDPRCWVKEMVTDPHGVVQSKGWKGQSPTVCICQVEDWGPKTQEEARRMDARFRSNINAAQALIPENVREAIEVFEPRFHWAILSLLARAPGFVERARSQPVLVLAVAKANYFKVCKVQRLYRAARRLQHRRSVDILRWLDWPSPKSALKLMGRFDPKEIKLCDLFRLRRLIKKGEPWVHHLRWLNRSALLLLDYHRPLVSFSVLQEAAEPTSGRRGLRYLQALRLVTKLVADVDAPPVLPVFKNLDHIHHVARSLARVRRAGGPIWPAGASGAPELRVPQPPFEGTVGEPRMPLVIRPLMTGQAIFDHSIAMQNCLAHSRTHLRPISKGQAAAYEVRWGGTTDLPETRCTAFLRRTKSGAWQLTEIAGVRNAQPPDWLTQKVWNWVMECSPTARGDLGKLPTPSERAVLEPDQLWIPF